MSGLSRRSVVGGGVAAALGAVGAAVAPARAQAAAAESEVAAGVQTRVPRHVLLRLGSVGIEGGLARGATLAGHARLWDATGREVGSVHSSGTVTQLSGVADALATQVVTIEGGTVAGVGLAHTRTLHGTYAVVGGTGAFTGARGSYEISEDSLHLTLLP